MGSFSVIHLHCLFHVSNDDNDLTVFYIIKQDQQKRNLFPLPTSLICEIWSLFRNFLLIGAFFEDQLFFSFKVKAKQKRACGVSTFNLKNTRAFIIQEPCFLHRKGPPTVASLFFLPCHQETTTYQRVLHERKLVREREITRGLGFSM